MKIVIQQWKESELELHAYRVIAEGAHQVFDDGKLGPDATIHVAWADTVLEASKKATAVAEAFGCRMRFELGPRFRGQRRKGARS